MMTTPFKTWNPFDWGHPDKKRIYFFSEGTAEDKSTIQNNINSFYYYNRSVRK